MNGYSCIYVTKFKVLTRSLICSRSERTASNELKMTLNNTASKAEEEAI